MSKLLRPLCLNLILTLVSVFVCIILAYIFSYIVNANANPQAVRFLKHGGGGVPTASLERYYWIRNFFMILGAAVGLVSAQVVWVLDALGKSGRDTAKPTLLVD